MTALAVKYSLKRLQDKMLEWMESGVRLAWLINP